MEKFFTCPNCPNHCQVIYTFQNGSIVDMNGCPCPKGMMTLLAELLPINQKKEKSEISHDISLLHCQTKK